MIQAQVGHTATLLGNGKVLIAGGEIPGGETARPPWPTANAELYDADTGMFASTGAYARGNAEGPTADRANLLADGRVLIVGYGPTELYDPVTGTFSLAGGGGLDEHTATLLMNGKVLVAGGEDPDSFSFFSDPANPFAYGFKWGSVYDPSTATFTLTGRMTIGRAFHTATLLPDGTVLITGSQLIGGGTLASGEIYDPGTGTFSATPNMTAPRSSHTSTLLPDGRVLIAGGFSPWPYPTASAELYSPSLLKEAPVLLSLSGDGQGPAAILHSATHEVVSPDNPAAAEESLEMYCTGLFDGSVIPPQVTIGGRMAEVLFFGNTPVFAGLNQVNVRVPGGIAKGPAVSVRLNYLGRPSNEVTIVVR